MSSPGLSSGAAHLFEDLWRRLRESHQDALQELEVKVSKLKKERCLDAQSLEAFYCRNQQLKEQNKKLQDAIGHLEERLRAGECDQCAILGENLKNTQGENLRLIAKLKSERSSLEGENRKLHAELQKFKMSRSSSDQEEGVIPDSPVLPSSLPAVNKLKKRRNVDKAKHVRYAEMPLPQPNRSLFNEVKPVEPVDATKTRGRAEVLVPNTCELDTSQIPNDVNLNSDEEVAETCGLELVDRPRVNTETTGGQRRSSKPPWKYGFHLKPYCSSHLSTLAHSPDSTTERSPSLLPHVRRFSEDGSDNKAKRKKQDCEPEVQQEDGGVDKQRESKRTQPELIKGTSAPLNSQSSQRQPLDSKQVKLAQNGTFNHRPNVSCPSPAFKKPNVRGEANKEGVERRGNPQQDLDASHTQREGEGAQRKVKVEPVWSIDPALAMSMYDSEWRGDEVRSHDQKRSSSSRWVPGPCLSSQAIEKEEEPHGELADTDCTWVSHSLLQCRGDRGDGVSGLGDKANDSLDVMFDTTACGEYKSYNSPHLGQSQPRDDDEEEEEEEEDDPHEDTMRKRPEHRARHPTFAHVAVIRKKDERRKLKGTTCKECEIYYTHLPEEEKRKKLSACSRHRFLYIPPSTPENFWEVGFPSTQTCIERGYIREEKNPQARTRRRQPFNALFSPKDNQQESQERTFESTH